MEIAAPILVLTIFGVPGLRLAGLWSRTRALPEALLAVFFVCMGIGIACNQLAIAFKDTIPLFPVRTAGVGLLMLGMTAFVFFTQRVFRPQAGAARIACGLYIVLNATIYVYLLATGLIVLQVGWTTQVLTLAGLMAIVWAFVECVAYYRRMRLQVATGLGDPLVLNRFLLWAIWTGSFLLLPIMSIAVRAWVMATTPAGAEPELPALLMLVTRLIVVMCALVAACSMWLSFFPPSRYRAWIAPGEAPS